MNFITTELASAKEALVVPGGEGFLGNRCRRELLALARTSKTLAWKNGQGRAGALREGVPWTSEIQFFQSVRIAGTLPSGSLILSPLGQLSICTNALRPHFVSTYHTVNKNSKKYAQSIPSKIAYLKKNHVNVILIHVFI